MGERYVDRLRRITREQAGGGWLIVRRIMADSKLQDCVMSGRKNCAPVEVDSAGR